MSVNSYAINTSPVTVVEIGNFFCGHCYDMENHIQPIKKYLDKNGGDFEFAPIYYGKFSHYPAQIYMAKLNQLDIVQDQIRKSLFLAANVLRMHLSSASSTCRIVSEQVKSVSLNYCLQALEEGRGMSRIANTEKLVSYLAKNKYLGEVIEFPVFVIEQDNQIKSVMSAADTKNMNELANNVLENIRSL